MLHPASEKEGSMRTDMTSSSFWKNWSVPLLFAVAVLITLGIGLSRILELPMGLGWILAALVSYGAYVFGAFRIYKYASSRLGYRCEFHPDPLPRSARQDGQYYIDIVISGNFRGRPFSLYRERDRGSNQKQTVYTVFEWVGEEIRLPDFTLQVSTSSKTQRVLAGFEKFATLIRPGINENATAHVEFESDTKLSGRSTLSATSPVSGRAVFTRAVCDALDPLVSVGRIEAGPGLLVYRKISASQLPWVRKKFPLPWEIEEHLKRGDEVRRIFIP